MLQQILRDMYVDPEILAELPEEQKEILFLKIRQEQVRRYYEKENKFAKSNGKAAKNNNKGKQVRFLEDKRGQPWTWVFGEDGQTVKEKWKKLEDKKMEAAIQAVVEEDMILKARGTTNKLMMGYSRTPPLEKKNMRNSPNSARKVSPCLARKEIKITKSQSLRNPDKKVITCVRPITPPKHMVNQQKEPILNRSVPVKQQSVPVLQPTIVKKPPIKSKPTNEKQLNGSKNNATTKVDSGYENFEPLKTNNVVSNEEWEKQLLKYKEEDQRRSFRARKASIEVRRQSQIALDQSSTFNTVKERVKRLSSDKQHPPLLRTRPTLPPKPNNIRTLHPLSVPGKSIKPNNKKEVFSWFQETQIRNVWPELKPGVVPQWFHGIIGRMDSESHLRKPGDYLIRLSDKMWGYALTYRANDRVKHFLIDASEPQCYHFFGNDQIRHESLTELVEYHKVEPITQNGEILQFEAGQLDLLKPDYLDLMIDDKDTRL